jgi:hypothetical protein
MFHLLGVALSVIHHRPSDLSPKFFRRLLSIPRIAQGFKGQLVYVPSTLYQKNDVFDYLFTIIAPLSLSGSFPGWH